MKKRIVISGAIIILILLAGIIFKPYIESYIYGIFSGVIEKPVIYIYPEKETEVSVKLGSPESLLVSYPIYENGWSVTAYPDGKLMDANTGRELYALYYESSNKISYEIRDDGFVVEGTEEALIPFFEEKLALLGLSEKESEEFIIYWLPQLMKNNYNYIRFASADEIEKNMSLEVAPAPQTTIRVLMTYKGLKNSMEVDEQILEPVSRDGYTVVEWGGTEIK